MIYTKIFKKRFSHNPEAGASLMLAVLILAAVTAIAFSLAVIVFIEIRSSGDSARTEPALYATLGVTEEALFQYKRFYVPQAQGDFNVPNCDGPVGANTCLVGGVTLSLPGTQPLSFDESPRVEFLSKGEIKVVPLYVVNDFNQQYSSVTVSPFPNQTSASITVHYLVTNPDGSTSTTVPVSVSPGSSYEFNQFLPTGQYDLIIANNSLSQDMSVKIDSVRAGNVTPNGLPFVGEQVLRIMADYLGLTRIYQVRIPIP